MDFLKKAGNILMNVVLWLVVVVVAFFSIVTFSQKSNDKVANVLGFTPLTVLTDSMAPTFKADDLIIIKSGDPSSHQAGDIISFWTVIENRRSINTHRVVEVVESNGLTQYVTRGDANNSNDDMIVSPGDVIGKYICSVPFVGKILTILSSSIGFLVIIVLPLLIFFIYQLYRFIVLMLEIKKQTVIEATKAAMEQLESEKNNTEKKESEQMQK